MTVIEFFSADPIDNVAGIVALRPQRVVFLGEREAMKGADARYRALAASLDCSAELLFREVDVRDFSAVSAVLSALCEEFSDAVFDLTGGEETMLAAMGQVYEQRLTTSPVSMHRFDLDRGTLHRVPDNSRLPLVAPLSLPIEAFVRLYGGAAATSADGDPLTSWDYSAESLSQIQAMWRVCAADPSRWNRAIGTLCGWLKYANRAASGEAVYIDERFVREKSSRFDEKADGLQEVLSALDRERVIEVQGMLSFTYGSPLVKYCMSKEGNLLEMYTLFTAMSLQGEDMHSLFCDANCGVYMDWDGRFGQPNNIHNEVDVMLMRGVTPIFISCKNGDIGDEELYKLRAVTDRFGGDRARAVLVATFVDRNPMTRAGLKERAAQMGIVMIDRVETRSFEEFASRLRSAAM